MGVIPFSVTLLAFLGVAWVTIRARVGGGARVGARVGVGVRVGARVISTAPTRLPRR